VTVAFASQASIRRPDARSRSAACASRRHSLSPTLALGIGANAAVLTLVRGVLLQRLPFTRADQLVIVTYQPEGSGYWHSSGFRVLRRCIRIGGSVIHEFRQIEPGLPPGNRLFASRASTSRASA
jgi:hypothetical protein